MNVTAIYCKECKERKECYNYEKIKELCTGMHLYELCWSKTIHPEQCVYHIKEYWTQRGDKILCACAKSAR